MAAPPRHHSAQTVVSEEPIALHLGKLREVNWGEVGIRFAFGAAVSLGWSGGWLAPLPVGCGWRFRRSCPPA